MDPKQNRFFDAAGLLCSEQVDVHIFIHDKRAPVSGSSVEHKLLLT